jgi:hypothetical protein
MQHDVAPEDLYPGDILNPLRRTLRHVKFFEAELCTVDLTPRIVVMSRTPGSFRTVLAPRGSSKPELPVRK